MKALLLCLISILLLFGACEIQKPSLPVWDIDLAIPLVNDSYYILELVDSVNIVIGDDDLLFLTGTGDVDTPEIGEVEFNPAIDESDIPLPSGINQSFELPFFDSQNNAQLFYGLVDTGSLSYRLNNILPETQEITISIADITDNQGQPLTLNYNGVDGWQTINLAGYHFGEQNSTTQLSALEVSFHATSTLPNGSILGTLDVRMNEAMSFSLFQGELNHMQLGINSSSASIDIDYPNGIDEAITLHDARLQIDVINHMGFTSEFSGFFEARRGTEVRRIPIVDEDGNNYVIAQSQNGNPGFSTLIFDNNISTLMQIMPEHIEIVDAAFTINTESGYGTLHKSDRIYMHYTVDAPFRFWLHDHTVSVEEAVKINISEDNREYISDNMLEAGLELEVMNKIPLGGWVRGYFGISPNIDPADTTTYSFSKELQLHSSQVSDTWQTLPPLTLTRSDLDLFINPEIYLKWEFSFEESQSLVEITATSADFIAIRSMLKGKLRIDQ